MVHYDTAKRIASALGLDDERRRRFEGRSRVGEGLNPRPSPGARSRPTRPPFRGRSRELESIKSTLLAGRVRLLTLTGPGGIGKTRLALEAAREIKGPFPEGCFLFR